MGLRWRPRRIYPVDAIPLTAVGKQFKPALLADAAPIAPFRMRGRLHRNPHRGVIWVIFDHLRPSGHIMPDHGVNRDATHLDPGASRSPLWQPCADGRLSWQLPRSF